VSNARLLAAEKVMEQKRSSMPKKFVHAQHSLSHNPVLISKGTHDCDNNRPFFPKCSQKVADTSSRHTSILQEHSLYPAELILLIWCSAVFRLHAIYTPHSSVRRAHFKVEENSSTQITMKFVKIITAAFLAANTFIGKFVFYPFISYDVV